MVKDVGFPEEKQLTTELWANPAFFFNPMEHCFLL